MQGPNTKGSKFHTYGVLGALYHQISVLGLLGTQQRATARSRSHLWSKVWPPGLDCYPLLPFSLKEFQLEVWPSICVGYMYRGHMLIANSGSVSRAHHLQSSSKTAVQLLSPEVYVQTHHNSSTCSCRRPGLSTAPPFPRLIEPHYSRSCPAPQHQKSHPEPLNLCPHESYYKFKIRGRLPASPTPQKHRMKHASPVGSTLGGRRR